MLIYKLIRILKEKRGDYVQFALAIPVFFALAYGGIIGFSLINAKLVVGNAAWEAARILAATQNPDEARNKANAIVSAHLPTDSASAVGDTTNVPPDYVTGILTKKNGYYYLSTLGNQPFLPVDGLLATQLDSYLGKNVAIKVGQISIPPSVDHSALVQGQSSLSETQENQTLVNGTVQADNGQP